MYKYCLHGALPRFSLQSSHLNICYYHQDLFNCDLRAFNSLSILLVFAWFSVTRMISDVLVLCGSIRSGTSKLAPGCDWTGPLAVLAGRSVVEALKWFSKFTPSWSLLIFFIHGCWWCSCSPGWLSWPWVVKFLGGFWRRSELLLSWFPLSSSFVGLLTLPSILLNFFSVEVSKYEDLTWIGRMVYFEE